jgi:hypothetical protein
MKSSCLIVTSELDTHADAVIKIIKNCNYSLKIVRLNLETFIQNSIYTYEWDSLGCLNEDYLHFLNSQKNAQNVKVIWWRNFKSSDEYNVFPEVTNEWAINYCQKEAESLVYSLIGLYPNANWVNSWHQTNLAFYRINQIPVAHKLGLKISPTIVTNSYEKALNFVQSQGECVVKSMIRHPSFSHNGKQYRCYTRKIDLETLEKMKYSIHLSPVFIQKKIDKKAEYRVTIIGQDTFVCRIDSQTIQDEDVSVDWRIAEPDTVPHYPDNLPSEYLRKLHNMLKEFKLKFGAFDIINNEEDSLYFIELNPDGQWYWIEILTGMPMTKAMVELIEELAN